MALVMKSPGFLVLALALATAGSSFAQATAPAGSAPPPPPGQGAGMNSGGGPGQGQGQAAEAGPAQGAKASPAEMYSIEQSVSDKAQLSTISFSALAFMTGTFGADSFLPPGKVADYFGFQYMRDIDASEAGHNMMFLTNIGNASLAVLDDRQKASLLALAKEQELPYRELAEKRLVAIKAFRDNMEGKAPSGTSLSSKAVMAWVSDIFAIDGQLALGRATVYGAIARSLSAAQKSSIAKLKFGDSGTWPSLPDQYDKRTMSHGQDVLYMTYASEFFSWYAGSEDADVYFCPERHGTYFGGFYMKDYPAMGKADYFIPTALTGDSGEAFLALLSPAQSERITTILQPLGPILKEILQIRRTISKSFRATMTGTAIDKEEVLRLSRRYGELDGQLAWEEASRFAAVYRTLTAAQKSAMVKLRNQDIFPKGYYLYADPVEKAVTIDDSALFSK